MNKFKLSKKSMAIILIVFIIVIIGTVMLTSKKDTNNEQIANLFVLKEEKSMLISIDYQTEPPEISFIAPDETRYDKKAISSGLMKFKQIDEDKVLEFRIPNAMTGQWRIVYDKKTNENIDVKYVSYSEAISITTMSYLVNNDNLTMTFLVSSDSDESLDYTLYLVVDDEQETSGQKTIAEGKAKANEMNMVTASLEKVSSYDNYKVKLSVANNANAIGSFDTRLSEHAFSYVNPNTPPAIEEAYVKVNFKGLELDVDWSECNVDATEYIIALYNNDNKEESYSTNLKASEKKISLVYNLENVTKLRVQLSYVSNGIVSLPCIKEIDMASYK